MDKLKKLNKWNAKMGDGCNRPIDCVDCEIIECPGRTTQWSYGGWRRDFNLFQLTMKSKLCACIPLKGEPSQSRLMNCPKKYLKEKLLEHLELDHFEDVGNFAFLLSQQEKANKNSANQKRQLAKAKNQILEEVID